MLHLAVCFNEGCLGTRENQKRLHAGVYPGGRWAIEVDPPEFIRKPAPQPVPPPPIVLPLGIPLDQLPATHSAVQYVRERGFDSAFLARRRGVTYCDISPSSRPPIQERLIIPIRQPGSLAANGGTNVLVGWQARTICGAEPKYLMSTGTRKCQLLYGLHQAVKTSGPVVVAEGTTDVWRIGPNAVALIGKTISPPQFSLVPKHFRGRPVVIWLDSDAAEDAEKVRSQVLASRVAASDGAPVLIASTPAGKRDPGECTADEIARRQRRS